MGKVRKMQVHDLGVEALCQALSEGGVPLIHFGRVLRRRPWRRRRRR